MKKFWIRWGMSVVMLILLVLVLIILQVVKLRTKVPVEVIWPEGETTQVVYVQKDRALDCSTGKHLRIELPGEQPMTFTITDMKEEAGYYRCKTVTPETDELKRRMSGNTKMEAYVFTREVKLWNLVFVRKPGQ